MKHKRQLWIDTQCEPVVTTTPNGEKNAKRWGWVEATAVPSAEVPEWAYTVGGVGEDGNVWADDPEYWGESGDPGIAESWAKEARDGGSFANAIVVKRRAPGPWLPVEGESK